MLSPELSDQPTNEIFSPPSRDSNNFQILNFHGPTVNTLNISESIFQCGETKYFGEKFFGRGQIEFKKASWCGEFEYFRKAFEWF